MALMASQSLVQIMEPIDPRQVRYIKLGEGGRWEQECFARGIIRFGFESGEPESMRMCAADDWAGMAESWRKGGKSAATATRFTNETRYFFKDPGDTLWVTFIGDRFCWGFLEPGIPTPSGDDDSCWRRVKGGWKHQDIRGQELSKSNLAGSITKLAAYRGTSCWVDVKERVVDRINGRTNPDVEATIAHRAELERSVLPLVKTLGPRDFEVLIDLIFSASGWRRLDSSGGTRKTLDLDLELPTTGERAFVQVKAKTNQHEFESYYAAKSEIGVYSRMFFVFHTGDVSSEYDDAIVIGPEVLGRMIVNSGLTDWVIQKAR